MISVLGVSPTHILLSRRLFFSGSFMRRINETFNSPNLARHLYKLLVQTPISQQAPGTPKPATVRITLPMTWLPVDFDLPM